MVRGLQRPTAQCVPHITGSPSSGHSQLQHLQLERKWFSKDNQPSWQGGNLKTQRRPQHEYPSFSRCTVDICVLTRAWESVRKAHNISEGRESVSLVLSDLPLHLYKWVAFLDCSNRNIRKGHRELYVSESGSVKLEWRDREPRWKRSRAFGSRRVELCMDCLLLSLTSEYIHLFDSEKTQMDINPSALLLILESQVTAVMY